jgi:hypothetical protein
MAQTERSRVPNALTRRVADSIAARSTSAAPAATFTRPPGARRRFEVLIMQRVEDHRRWQMIHNDKERYKVIEEKMVNQRTEISVEYACLMTYEEIGDDLPLVKTLAELRADDEARIRATEAEDPTFTELFGTVRNAGEEEPEKSDLFDDDEVERKIG